MFGSTFNGSGDAYEIDWNPSGLSFGAMNTVVTTVLYAQAYIMGPLCFFDIRAIIETTGVGGIVVCVSPPVNMFSFGAGYNPAFVASVLDVGAADVGRGVLDPASQQIRFVKLGNVAWGIGTNKSIIGQGFYKIQ